MSKLKIGPGVMLNRRHGKTEAMREGLVEHRDALRRLMDASEKMRQYENGDFPDPKVTYKQVVAEYLAALDGAKDE